MKDRTIYLMRHAESVSNAGEAVLNAVDIQLSEKGKQQTLDIARELLKLDIDRVYISKYTRTLETIKPYLVLTGKEISGTLPVEEFVYLPYSKHNGVSKVVRRAYRKEFFDEMDPDFRLADDSESFSDLIKRVDRFSDIIVDLPDKSLVVGHAFYYMAWICRVNFLYSKSQKELMEFICQTPEESRITNCQIIPVSIKDHTYDRADYHTINLPKEYIFQ